MLIVLEQGHVGYAIALMAGSLLLMHAFVYALDFRGQHETSFDGARLPAFVSLTLPGYALVLLISLLVLWLFGRLDGPGVAQSLHLAVVLGFPAPAGSDRGGVRVRGRSERCRAATAHRRLPGPLNGLRPSVRVAGPRCSRGSGRCAATMTAIPIGSHLGGGNR